jgi:hypothetical protein
MKPSPQPISPVRVLIAGWFSFQDMGATAGDRLACDLLCERLTQSNIPFDVALASPFPGGVDWRSASPTLYSHLVFVCGPLGNGWPVDELLARYSSSRLIGLNLSMLDPLEQWNPFDLLFERDSNRTCRPDIAMAAPTVKVPLVGSILAHVQKEYGERARHRDAHEVVRNVLHRREAAVVAIDTNLVGNTTGLRSAREIVSLIGSMDLVITTRLHGMVLALKNGVPALAIDPIAGGAKISRQAAALGWPLVFRVEELKEDELLRAFDECQSSAARKAARACAERATGMIEPMLDELIQRMALQTAG